MRERLQAARKYLALPLTLSTCILKFFDKKLKLVKIKGEGGAGIRPASLTVSISENFGQLIVIFHKLSYSGLFGSTF